MRIIIDQSRLYHCQRPSVRAASRSLRSAPPDEHILMAHLELEGIVQRYGAHTVVDGVSFPRRVSGSIACLLGPSACGKTTLLRCIAGFEPTLPPARSASRAARSAAPAAACRRKQRQIGMVFQDYALFPHLTVAANVGFGLATSRRRAAAQSGQRIAGHGRSRGSRRKVSARTLGWSAAAGGPGARLGAASATHSARRTLLQPRR
jgi:ABC-type taurine transport system ATPase subunit